MPDETGLDPAQLAEVRADHDAEVDPERFLIVEVVVRVGYVGSVSQAHEAAEFVRQAVGQKYPKLSSVDWTVEWRE